MGQGLGIVHPVLQGSQQRPGGQADARPSTARARRPSIRSLSICSWDTPEQPQPHLSTDPRAQRTPREPSPPPVPSAPLPRTVGVTGRRWTSRLRERSSCWGRPWPWGGGAEGLTTVGLAGRARDQPQQGLDEEPVLGRREAAQSKKLSRGGCGDGGNALSTSRRFDSNPLSRPQDHIIWTPGREQSLQTVPLGLPCDRLALP